MIHLDISQSRIYRILTTDKQSVEEIAKQAKWVPQHVRNVLQKLRDAKVARSQLIRLRVPKAKPGQGKFYYPNRYNLWTKTKRKVKLTAEPDLEKTAKTG